MLGIVIGALAACDLPLGMAPLPRLTPSAIPTPDHCEPIRLETAQHVAPVTQLDAVGYGPPVAMAFDTGNRRLTVVYATSTNRPGQVATWEISRTQVVKTLEIAWIHPKLTRLNIQAGLLATADDRSTVVDQRRREFPERLRKWIVAINDIWDITSGRRYNADPQLADILALDISPDGRQLLTGDSLGVVHLSSTDPQVTFGGEALHLDTVNYGIQVPVVVAFDRGGDTYAYATEDGEIGIRILTEELQSEHGIIIANFSRREEGRSLDMDFDATRQWLAVLREQSIEVHDIQSFFTFGPQVTPLPGVSTGSIAFNPQGDLVITVTSNGWQLRRTRDLALLQEDAAQPMSALAVSDDGCYVAFGGINGTVQVWGIQ
jgi:WD40 repeat protein